MSNRVDNDPKEPPEAGSETAVAEPVRPETHKTSDLRAHLMEMDALRGIAIIGVVIQHLTGSRKSAMGPMPIPFLGVDDLTAFVVIPGVPLFFILSGYLLS